MADPRVTRALIDVIARGSPLLSVGAAEVAAARARAMAAGFAGPLVLSAEIEEVPGGVDVSRGNVRAEVSREFLSGGRSAAARALAGAETRTAEIALEAARLRLTARATRALADAVAGAHTAARLAAEDSLLEAAESWVRDRFSVGEARYVDVLRLRTERLRVQTDYARALAEARAGLEVLIGLGGPDGAAAVSALVDTATVMLPSSVQTPLPPGPATESLLTTSARLLRASAAVERAQAALSLLRSGQRTRIAASLGAQRFVEDGSATIGPLLGVSVTLPFTAAGANRAAALAGEREVALAEAVRSNEIARLRSQISVARTRYESARERLAVYDGGLLRGAREERESALAAYRNGDLSLLELLDFERALARAEIERVRARAEAVAAYADLMLAAAGGVDLEEER